MNVIIEASENSFERKVRRPGWRAAGRCFLLFLLVSIGAGDLPLEAQEKTTAPANPEEQRGPIVISVMPSVTAAPPLKSKIVFYWQLENRSDIPVAIENPRVLLTGGGTLETEKPLAKSTSDQDGGFLGGLRTKIESLVLPSPYQPTLIDQPWQYGSDRKKLCAQGEGICSWNSEIPPRQKLLLPAVLRASATSTETGAILRFTATAKWQQDGQARQQELVEIVNAQIGYAELQQLPAALSLPSIALLPGVLLIVFYRFSAGRKDPEGSWLKSLAERPSWLIAAITVTVGVGLCFWHYSRRNILEGMSLIDLLQVWMWTLFAGLVLGGLKRLWDRYRAKHLDDETPRESDSPRDALRKAIAHRSSFSLYFPTAKRGADPRGNPAEDVFRSWRESCWFEVARDEKVLWLAPVIRVEPIPKKKDSRRAFERRLARLASRPPFFPTLFKSQQERLARFLIHASGAGGLVFLSWADDRHPRRETPNEDGNTASLERRATDLCSFFDYLSPEFQEGQA